MNCTSNPAFDEHRWIIRIRRTLEEEHDEDENEVPVSIFNVPKALMAGDPDSYTPQQVAIGPYHYLRPELHEMERYKLSAAKRARKSHGSLRFEGLVEQLALLEPRIRSSYHKYLDFNGETLAWMMAIDASFLIELLQIYGNPEGGKDKVVGRDSTRLSHLLDYGCRKSAHNMILRDMVMLENQIPLFVLKKVMEFQSSSSSSSSSSSPSLTSDDSLLLMLLGLSQELSPFKIADLPQAQLPRLSHLLDFLYQTIVPQTLQEHLNKNASEINQEDQHQDQEQDQERCSRILLSLKKLNQHGLELVKRALTSKPAKLMLRLPWEVISNLPIFAILKQPVESLLEPQETETQKPPLVDEIAIPSVTELSRSGVRFSPTNGNITTISFDTSTATLHLPTVTLDANTNVVMRNLVAYEAASSSGPLVFARYTELMNGIIDTAEDVRVLRERGVVVNRMKSDEEVAELWNGMSRSMRLTRVGFLDKVIGDVNVYYDGRWRIKVGRFVRIHVFGSWQALAFAAAVLLLLLVALQTFFSIYRYNHGS